MPNIKKSVELKKFQGTYRKDRDAEAEKVSDVLKATSVILDANSVSCPKTITDKYCRKYWKLLTKNLLSIKVLSGADIPQLEMMFVYLQKLREVQQYFLAADPADEVFDLMQARYEKLEKRFNTIAGKYYISPADRAKLKIDELTAVKAQQDILKNQSAIGRLINK
ncbi:hypothetical protein [Treponema sp.]|uniref:hypothetical protein n=1 Tax=Treponema sp. TaxID=166 RepID=UPI0025F01F26|nr:hypothetical protein [Treponema sp.]MCR5218603.1 hypothetical protein [Treponema sp.]